MSALLTSAVIDRAALAQDRQNRSVAAPDLKASSPTAFDAKVWAAPAPDAGDRGSIVKPAPLRGQDDLASLINALGAARYYERQRAERRLLDRGASAFDALTAALESDSAEIAARARSLLTQIDIDFVRPDEPPAVCELLSNYAQLPSAERRQTITRLAELPENEGVAALARIARFERSPRISRTVAAKLITSVVVNDADWQAQRQEVGPELGASQRVTIAWLRLHVNSNTTATDATELAAMAEKWRSTAMEEFRRLRSGVNFPQLTTRDTEPVLDLLEHAGRFAHRAAVLDGTHKQVLLAVANDMIRASDDSVPSLLRTTRALRVWDLPELLPALQAQHGRALAGHSLLAKVFAIHVEKLGDPILAQEARAIAIHAARSTPTELRYYPYERELSRLELAFYLEREGQFAAAENEYRQTMQSLPADDEYAILARVLLGELLAGQEKLADAASLFRQAASRIESERARGRIFPTNIDPAEIESRAEFFDALAHQSTNEKVYLRMLKQSTITDPSNPDGLIELYKAHGMKPSERSRLRLAINHALNVIQQRVVAAPQEPRAYNLWAWLAATTGGDVEQALRYSRESLRLEPTQGSYFDTMASCYAAQGNYVEAVRCQSRAARIRPFSRSDQKRLAEYQGELTITMAIERGN